ncbi:MAG: dihydrodipicolinate synthase family protein, partial [Actinomycetota bacterium]
ITGSYLDPEAVDRLAAHERIVGMKDSSPDAQRRARFVAAAERATGSFAVVSGHAPTLRDALEAGVTGSILAVANVRQRQAVGLHAAVAAGDQEQAGELQRRLTATTEGLQRVGRSTQAALKASLQLEGVIAERWCVPPLDSVPPDQLDLVRTAMLS